MDDLGLEEISSDPPATLPKDIGIGPDLEANVTLNARLPHGGVDPDNGLERSQADPRAYNLRMEVPVPSSAAEPIPEQDAGVRINDSHSEGETHIAMGLED